MKILRWLSYLTLAGALLNRMRIRSVWGALLFVPRLVAGALLPVLAALGLLSAWLGWRRDMQTWLAGATAAWLSIQTIRRMTAPQKEFQAAFGDGWRTQPTLQQQARMLQRRWTWWLPQPPAARIQRDVVYWTLPDGRDLLCDMILPPPHIQRSGMALIYIHGSAWNYGDKGTNPAFIFQHLAAQGHVIMNAGYRLAPETDCLGMIADAKRAVAYLKSHADKYHVDPERIVMSGASAGGHLALMAAYTAGDPDLQPEDVEIDSSVRGMISFYGVVDLRHVYEFAEPLYSSSSLALSTLERAFRAAGLLKEGDHLTSPTAIMRNLMGCLPSENPERYRQMSPLHRVGPACPPTLLLHGDADWLVPVEQARYVHKALREAGVQTVLVEIPDADHGFDMFLTEISPAAQVALYAVERFMAILA